MISISIRSVVPARLLTKNANRKIIATSAWTLSRTERTARGGSVKMVRAPNASVWNNATIRTPNWAANVPSAMPFQRKKGTRMFAKSSMITRRMNHPIVKKTITVAIAVRRKVAIGYRTLIKKMRLSSTWGMPNQRRMQSISWWWIMQREDLRSVTNMRWNVSRFGKQDCQGCGRILRRWIRQENILSRRFAKGKSYHQG